VSQENIGNKKGGPKPAFFLKQKGN